MQIYRSLTPLIQLDNDLNIAKVGVVGAGTMGNGIAQVFAMNGVDVTLADVSDQALARGMAAIDNSLDRLLAKDKITRAVKDETLTRIRCLTAIDGLRDVDLAIEAATENLDLKLGIFRDLDRVCAPQAIIATNTSSLSITKLAGATKRASQVIGMHFMNPVPVMQLIEVIRALQTSDETYETIAALSKKIGKTPVAVKNNPGFVANRILMPTINEAIFARYENLASAEDIDTVMQLGMNHPIGPLALADLIGLDTCLSVMQVLHAGFGDSKYRPCPLLYEMVEAGYLGRKTGRGFYDYPDK